MSGLMKILGAAGVAAAAWYLLEPKNGAKHRDKLAKGANDLYKSTAKRAGEMYGTASDEIGRISKEVGREVTSAVDRMGELASSVTGGASAAVASHDGNGTHRNSAAKSHAS